MIVDEFYINIFYDALTCPIIDAPFRSPMEAVDNIADWYLTPRKLPVTYRHTLLIGDGYSTFIDFMSEAHQEMVRREREEEEEIAYNLRQHFFPPVFFGV